jgi:glutamate formiminotransferase/formiminotetrahydrofolate cyclodeaminase
MSERLIECVPNFSEGRDPEVIRAITSAIEEVAEVMLLDVDPGKATNRTVVTFVGPPEAVLEAAVRAAKRGTELIDMRKHKGEHPRFGALDVCPLVPVSGVTMEETVELARRLGGAWARGGQILRSIATSTRPSRRPARTSRTCATASTRGSPRGWPLATTRPTSDRRTLNERSGRDGGRRRDFLVAYNVNLNTTSTRRANAIAFDVREKGRERLDPQTMKPVKDAAGQTVWDPGLAQGGQGHRLVHRGVRRRAGLAEPHGHQRHADARRVRRVLQEAAEARGVRVTGSELVGWCRCGRCSTPAATS